MNKGKLKRIMKEHGCSMIEAKAFYHIFKPSKAANDANPSSSHSSESKTTFLSGDWINKKALERLTEVENRWDTVSRDVREQMFISAFHCATPNKKTRKRAARILDRFDRSRVCIVDRKGRDAFNALPDNVTLFRGAKNGEKIGISWTTDLEVARWFACESVNKEDGHVLKLVINKRNISAVIAGLESEYLVRVKRAMGATILETTEQIRKIRKSHYRQRDWMKVYG